MKRFSPFLICWIAVLALACGDGPMGPAEAVDTAGPMAPGEIPGVFMAKGGSGKGATHAPFAFTVPGCYGNEDVGVTGSYRTQSKATESPNGSRKISVRFNAHGTGQGMDTGADYIWVDSFTDYFLHYGPNHFNGKSQRHTRLIGKGKAPNVRFDLFMTFYLDREGAVQIESMEVRGCNNLRVRY